MEINQETLFYFVWNWIGLGAAGVLLILLFFSDVLRSDVQKKRWKDFYWLAWLCVVAYLFHNTEEYGIDFSGKIYAFPSK